MNYWILRCDTDEYDLDGRLADPDPNTTWLVNQNRQQIHENDVAFVWANGKKGGIRAVLHLDSEPIQMREIPTELKYQKTKRPNHPELRVLARFKRRDVHLLPDEVRAVEGLEGMSVFTGFRQRTNIEVTPEQGRLIEELIAKAPNQHR